jgi:hypothetical protein
VRLNKEGRMDGRGEGTWKIDKSCSDKKKISKRTVIYIWRKMTLNPQNKKRMV